MKKIQRSTLIPSLLLIYLAVMSIFGYKSYASGQNSALSYFGGIGLTLFVIILLHFTLKRREKLRRERENGYSRE